MANAAPSKRSNIADVTNTDDSLVWSIEPVCENGIRLDFFAKEPNAASVIMALFEKIYEPNPNKVLLSKENWREEKSTQFRIICDLACRLAIPDQTVLNKHYRSFSNGTYGETDYEQFQSILNQLGVKETDTFIDVGSGIGHLVTFAAAYSKCAYVSGIELEQVPADFATKNGIQFKRLMDYFGEHPRPFKLEKGDFKEHKHSEFLKNKAKIIFCNNFAFKPELMLKFREILESCESGTKIVVIKKLETTRSENRVAHDCFFTQMANTSLLQSTGTKTKPNVSWTIKTIDYFLTVMDLEKPFRDAAQRAQREEETRLARQTRTKRGRAARN